MIDEIERRHRYRTAQRQIESWRCPEGVELDYVCRPGHWEVDVHLDTNWAQIDGLNFHLLPVELMHHKLDMMARQAIRLTLANRGRDSFEDELERAGSRFERGVDGVGCGGKG